ncbi:hypothetical protein GGF42_003270, partial [Coemansia sp. RSA 2424]
PVDLVAVGAGVRGRAALRGLWCGPAGAGDVSSRGAAAAAARGAGDGAAGDARAAARDAGGRHAAARRHGAAHGHDAAAPAGAGLPPGHDVRHAAGRPAGHAVRPAGHDVRHAAAAHVLGRHGVPGHAHRRAQQRAGAGPSSAARAASEPGLPAPPAPV